MLEQLFGSKTRVHLLRLFLANQEERFFVRQLTRKIGAQINAVRNELDNLAGMGIIEVVTDGDYETAEASGERSAGQRKYFRINKDCLFFPELRALFAKSGVLLERQFVQRLNRAGTVQYLALMGYFVGEVESPTDIFIVGKLAKDKVTAAVRSLEQGIGKEVNYTVMNPAEFTYRKELTDRFLYEILDSRKMVLVDALAGPVSAEAEKQLAGVRTREK
ncbi:MAG: hypothetical protein ABIJ46_01070 [bacterium]